MALEATLPLSAGGRDRLSGDSPRVSVGLPVFNGERYLAVALDALLAQTYTDFEIVISDNGSTDSTEAISRDYAIRDPRVRYHRAAENRGLAWNFNRVVELARGEYFRWAAYDDLCSRDYLERCVTILDAQPDVVWCHSRTCYIDTAGERLAGGPSLGFLNPLAAESSLAWTRGAGQPYQRFLAVMTGPGEVYDIYGLVRLAALRRTGLHRPFYGADRVLLAELSLMGRYAEVPEELFFARRHPEQTVFGPRSHIERQTSGRTKQRWFAPKRLHRAWWMLRLVMQADIGLAERMRCLGAWAMFALHPKKWKRLAIDTLRSVGIRVAVPEDAVRQAAFAAPTTTQPTKRD